jgi:hypothetical protein
VTRGEAFRGFHRRVGEAIGKQALRLHAEHVDSWWPDFISRILSEADWAPLGTNAAKGQNPTQREGLEDPPEELENLPLAAGSENGSDGTRTRGLRRDRPAL